MALWRKGKLDEKMFAEMRLRHGVYGQRYDNDQRHDYQYGSGVDPENVGLADMVGD